MFLVLQALVGLLVLVQFNRFAIGVGIASLGVVAIYPFMKRFTYWPQIFLGLAFSWGALMGWAAARGALEWPAFLLYAGSIAWVIHYDTIYAHQDREDDALVGLEIDRAAVRREHQADAGAVFGRGGDPDRACRLSPPTPGWCSRSGSWRSRRIWPGRSFASTSTIRIRACGCFAPTATPA